MNFWQDSNGRTIWYSGEAGPLAPKVKKVKGRMIWKADKRVPVSGETEVEETQAVLWIRDFLVRIRMRIRILGSVSLSDRSRCGSLLTCLLGV
jgi:hypothetical protein